MKDVAFDGPKIKTWKVLFITWSDSMCSEIQGVRALRLHDKEKLNSSSSKSDENLDWILQVGWTFLWLGKSDFTCDLYCLN